MLNGDLVKFVNTGKEYDADEVGTFALHGPRRGLNAATWGIYLGIKTSKR